LYFVHPGLFRWMANILVSSEVPAPAEAIFVLAGDWSGERVITAAELARKGFAPVVMVSGPMEIYGFNEANLAIDYAVKKGYPRALFQPFYNHSLSTSDEGAAMKVELLRRGMRNVMVVTSNFHTARAGRTLRRAMKGSGVNIHMIAADYQFFHPDSWWKDREARKTFYYEFTKTIADPLGF
jgi:uncharacterized SAM-binding protein YcdF (DUF218 family)